MHDSGKTSSSDPGDLRRNIELKSRIDSLDPAREIAGRIATAHPGRQCQLDTYFNCPHGRLKLRQIEGEQAMLIWYHRENVAGAKASDYRLVPVTDAQALKKALGTALGVRAVVNKRREIFLYHHVRIHLDEVNGLGCFLEFEAVLEADTDPNEGIAQVEFLMQQFSVDASSLVTNSYGDMVTSEGTGLVGSASRQPQ